MAETIYLRIFGDEQTPAAWLQPDNEGGMLLGRGELAQAASALGTRAATVLVPAEQVLLTRVELPVRNRQRLLQALPFALEEDLVDPVDELHFAPGPAGAEDGATAVAVVRDEYMRHWLGQLEAAGIHAPVMLPDVLALPRRDNGWSLWLESGVALLRTSATQGLALDPDNLELLLPALFEQEAGASPEAEDQHAVVLDVYLCGEQALPETLHELLAQHSSDIREHRVEDLLEVVRTPPSDTLPETTRNRPNLRQGPHASHSEQRELWRRWRPAAILAAIVVVLQLGVDVWELQRLESRLQTTQAASRELFREAFPDVERIVDMRVQARREMSRLRQGGGNGDTSFLWLMQQLARAMEDTTEVQLRSLSYQTGRLELQLGAPELAAIENMRSGMRSGSVEATIQSVSSEDDGVSVRLTMQEQAS